MNYRVAYSIGFHPWEDAATDPPFVNKFDELIGREEKRAKRTIRCCTRSGHRERNLGNRIGETRLASHGNRHR